jgi:ribosomal protein S9
MGVVEIACHQKWVSSKMGVIKNMSHQNIENKGRQKRVSLKMGVIKNGCCRNPNYRPTLKQLGLLTRDLRKVQQNNICKIKACNI